MQVQRTVQSRQSSRVISSTNEVWNSIGFSKNACYSALSVVKFLADFCKCHQWNANFSNKDAFTLQWSQLIPKPALVEERKKQKLNEQSKWENNHLFLINQRRKMASSRAAPPPAAPATKLREPPEDVPPSWWEERSSKTTSAHIYFRGGATVGEYHWQLPNIVTFMTYLNSFFGLFLFQFHMISFQSPTSGNDQSHCTALVWHQNAAKCSALARTVSRVIWLKHLPNVWNFQPFRFFPGSSPKPP